MQNTQPRRILLRILGALLTVLLLSTAGFALILAQPQADAREKKEPQPPLSAAASLEIRKESDFRRLVEGFPIPVMSLMSGSGFQFVSGTSSDFRMDGGFGRIATMYWQTEDGIPMALQSIYPADALGQLASGYHFTPVAGPTLFGADSVRMENADTVRVHASNGTGLYVMIVPKSAADRVSAFSRSLQLFSVRE